MSRNATWLALCLIVPVLLSGCSVLPAAEQVVVNVPQPAPAEALRIRVANTSSLDLADLPSRLALDRLSEQGYEVASIDYAQSELAVQALAQGDADFGTGSTRTFWAAVARGAPIASVAGKTANDWSIFVAPDIQTCADLDGRRLAQHSEGATSKAMTDVYLKENCPAAAPELLIIPGSDNRAAALLAGEIDATPLELADALQIEEEAPGRFRILVNFARDLPGLKTSMIHVNRDFAAAHPEAVKDYLRALLTVHRQIADDPARFVAEAADRLETDEEMLARIVAAYLGIGMWDANGGLDEESLAYTLRFFTGSGELDPDLTVTDVADLSFLEEVLGEMGRE